MIINLFVVQFIKNIYIYIYTQVQAYTHTCTHIHIRIPAHIHAYTHIYTRTHKHTHTHTHIYIYIYHHHHNFSDPLSSPIVVLGLPLNVATIILSFIFSKLLSDFRPRGPISLPTPPIAVLTEFFFMQMPRQTSIHCQYRGI